MKKKIIILISSIVAVLTTVGIVLAIVLKPDPTPTPTPEPTTPPETFEPTEPPNPTEQPTLEPTVGETQESEYGEANREIDSNISYDENSYAPYSIYPVPHDLSYNTGYYYVPQNVNIVLEEGIDDATIDHLYSTLGIKDILSKRSNDITNEKNVLVGIYNSNGIVDKYLNMEDELFNKIDSYYLKIDNNNIIIFGKDTDACYYAITTLKWIFNQTTNTIRTLTIKDYSDTVLRGFIEGYYGIPWTTDERIELMEYGSLVKSNIYIYAPKDDSYHSTNWRELYNQSDLLDLVEQIEAGRKTKTRFAWAIHPFLSKPITSANYTEGVEAVKTKFEQLYQNGVRQFVISADDVPVDETHMVDAELQKNLLNEISAWCKSKEGCYDLIFVPSAYCYKSLERLQIYLEPYFKELCNGLDKSVEIMWTGEEISSSVSTGMFDEFYELTGRNAFMWLNWPVNDYSVEHLLMGKAEVLNERISYDENVNFSGIVTNPMQQAEESKLSIFAISDYCWNINGFNCDKSYIDSFKTVEPVATNSFYKLCQHMVNATLYEGKYFAESEEFAPLIEGFEEVILAFDLTRIPKLISLYQEIIENANDYLLNGSNLKLKESIIPWVNSLKLMAEESIIYLEILNDPDNELAIEWYRKAEKIALERIECRAPVLNKISYNIDMVTADVGVSRLKPFLSLLSMLAKDAAYLTAGEYLGVTYRGFDGVYEGSLENIIDGDDSSYVWMDGYPKEDAYIRIDLGEIKTINDITILQGNDLSTDSLTGIIQISNDGKEYNTIGNVSGTNCVLDLRENPVSGRYLRLVSNSALTWVMIREIKVNELPKLTKKITFGNIKLETSVNTDKSFMIDDDLSTFTWFFYNRTEGAYLLLDLLDVKRANYIGLFMANTTSPSDYFHDYKLSYSINENDYIEIGSFTTATLEYYFENDVDLRYVKVEANSLDYDNGIIVRELTAGIKPRLSYNNNVKVYDGATTNVFDGDLDTYVWFENINESKNQNGIELTFDINDIKNVSKITISMDEVDYFRDCEILYSSDGQSYISLGEYSSAIVLIEEEINFRFLKIVSKSNETYWIKIIELILE